MVLRQFPVLRTCDEICAQSLGHVNPTPQKHSNQNNIHKYGQSEGEGSKLAG